MNAEAQDEFVRRDVHQKHPTEKWKTSKHASGATAFHTSSPF